MRGAVADDFTGATDLAGNWRNRGLRTAVVLGVPREDSAGLSRQDLSHYDALVVAQKIRSIPTEQARDAASEAGHFLLDLGCTQIYDKYCSTFDSTPDGNIGPIADVQAMTGTLARDIEVEDTGVLSVRWRNGALGSMAVTMLTYPKNLEGSITIIGEKGTARVGGVAVNEIQLWDFSEPKDYDETIRNASYETTSLYGFGHPLYYKNVIDVLRGDAAPETDGREGLKSLEVLIAAYRSGRDHKTVSLPLAY